MRIEILRRASAADKPRWQCFEYEPASEAETVATALTRLNERDPLTDTEGRTAAPIRWECSCLQKKCGACAMVINGRPGLACDTRLREGKGILRLEPLRKFPPVADLIVDRGILFDNLRTVRAWLDREAPSDERKNELAYEASRCLQCGCCLEICPNFAAGGQFYGMAAAVPAARLLTLMPAEERRTLAQHYRSHVFEGCGKSLACRNICPAGINMDAVLAGSNAVAVWRRLAGRRK